MQSTSKLPGRPNHDGGSVRLPVRFGLCWLLLFAGCQYMTSENRTVVQVEGRVLLDDQPVVDAQVVFVPEQSTPGTSGFAISYGVTDSAGRYQLAFKDGTSGVLAGKHRVLVSKRLMNNGDYADDNGSWSGMPALEENGPVADVSDVVDPDFLIDNQFQPEQIPFYYNVQSELKLELPSATGIQQHDLKLSSVDPLLRR